MLHVRSILIAAVALSCLAALSIESEAKAALLDVNSIALPFNDLLPPLFESETSSNDIATTTLDGEQDDDKPTTVAPTKATTSTNTPTTRKPTATFDPSNGTKLGAKIVTSIASKPAAATVLPPLPFNDLLPPLLEPIESNDVPAAFNLAEETRVATTILRMTTRQPAQSATPAAYKFPIATNTVRPSISSRVPSAEVAVKPSKLDSPKKYYKKPNQQQQQKFSQSQVQERIEFHPETVRQYLENFHHTTYRPRKANLPTLTPFPRHLK